MKKEEAERNRTAGCVDGGRRRPQLLDHSNPPGVYEAVTRSQTDFARCRPLALFSRTAIWQRTSTSTSTSLCAHRRRPLWTRNTARIAVFSARARSHFQSHLYALSKYTFPKYIARIEELSCSVRRHDAPTFVALPLHLDFLSCCTIIVTDFIPHQCAGASSASIADSCYRWWPSTGVADPVRCVQRDFMITVGHGQCTEHPPSAGMLLVLLVPLSSAAGSR